jgi:hypothetical protein
MRETRLRCRGISTRDDVFPYTAITVQEQSEPRASNSLLCLWTRAAHLLPL